jgi:anti-sigma-K factor RskA
MEEAILDLLCKDAVYGLSEDEQRELAQLEQSANSGMDSHSLELAAAAISMAGLEEFEPMPEHLQAKIMEDISLRMSSSDANAEKAFSPKRQPVIAESESRSSIWNWLGWAVAGAASVALAFNIFSTQRQAPIVAGGPTPTPTVSAKPSLEQLRSQLIAAGAQVIKAEWGKGNGKEIEQISGDVVWSDSKQEGYMRFRGLPKNDPGKETYQLWIFDETQDEKTPIDGGTFDVNSDGEVIVPIDAKLKAKNPKLFAVTIEKPGGVVVSKREKIAALAKTETTTS